ncbi:hypothetical protein V8E36_003517 [Tilletia maclaganii]
MTQESTKRRRGAVPQFVLFGSRATILGPPRSDLDIFVDIDLQLPDPQDYGLSANEWKDQARTAMYRQLGGLKRVVHQGKLNAITSKRVSIVSFVSTAAFGSLEVDIGFSDGGPDSSAMINLLCQHKAEIGILATVLKTLLGCLGFGSGKKQYPIVIIAAFWVLQEEKRDDRSPGAPLPHVGQMFLDMIRWFTCDFEWERSGISLQGY